MRIPLEWREGVGGGRILLLSPFEPSQRRLTAALSEQRNRLVAALANEVYFAHTSPGGKTAALLNKFLDGAFLSINDRTFDFAEQKNFA